MSVDDILELSEIAAQLQATTSKLPQGLRRDEVLRDIDRFRAQLAHKISALKAEK
jgi:hypothetical protein